MLNSRTSLFKFLLSKNYIDNIVFDFNRSFIFEKKTGPFLRCEEDLPFNKKSIMEVLKLHNREKLKDKIEDIADIIFFWKYYIGGVANEKVLQVHDTDEKKFREHILFRAKCLSGMNILLTGGFERTKKLDTIAFDVDKSIVKRIINFI